MDLRKDLKIGNELTCLTFKGKVYRQQLNFLFDLGTTNNWSGLRRLKTNKWSLILIFKQTGSRCTDFDTGIMCSRLLLPVILRSPPNVFHASEMHLTLQAGCVCTLKTDTWHFALEAMLGRVVAFLCWSLCSMVDETERTAAKYYNT